MPHMRYLTPRLAPVLTVIITACFAPAAAAPGDGETSFEWSGELASGQLLEIRDVEGNIQAELAAGNTVEVLARKSGRPADLEQVPIEVVEHGDGVTICVQHPGWQGNDRCSGKADRKNIRYSRQEVDVRVDFVVRVPVGVELIARTISGDVVVRGLHSDVDASSVDGDVEVETTEVARASTVSGRIDVKMGSLQWDRLEFSTVSGDITLTLPDDLDTRVEFESLSGSFDSDFRFDSFHRDDERMIGEEVRARIGSGQRKLIFETVSGDVRLRRPA